LGKTSPIDKKKLEREVFEKTKRKSEKIFKPQVKGKITDAIIRNAVDEALKGFTPDQVVLALRFSERHCEKCGECCRVNNPIIVDVQDLINIAFYLGVDLDLVMANYTKVVKDERISLKTNPCPFLTGNECSIYPARPKICVIFPLQVKDDMLVPVIFEYCNFSKNLIVEKAISFIVVELIKLTKPEVHKELEEYAKQLQSQVPADWKEQIKFVDKLLFAKTVKK